MGMSSVLAFTGCRYTSSKRSGHAIPARNTPPITALRRAYFQPINYPVQVDTTRARAVAAKNIFIGSAFGAVGVEGVAGGFGALGSRASGIEPSAFEGADGASLLGGR